MVKGYDIQGGGSEGSDLQEKELGSDRVNAESAGRVPPLGGLADIRDISLEKEGRGDGSSHRWRRPWMQRGCGKLRIIFGGGRLPLRNTS